MVRDRPEYRRQAVDAGIARLGFAVVSKPNLRPSPEDVLLIWNRYGPSHALAKAHEKVGAAVIVIENGYLPMRRAKKTFAIALNYHNGAGHWYVGDQPRARLLDVKLLPWRGDGTCGDVVLLPQRGVGPPGVAMPRHWEAEVTQRLVRAGVERGRMRTRPHPGNFGVRSGRSLEADVDAAGLCVVWASSAGIKALVRGCPVVHELQRWVAAAGGSYGAESALRPRLGDRERMLEEVAWAQWSDAEVTDGLPFEYLLELHENRCKKIAQRSAELRERERRGRDSVE